MQFLILLFSFTTILLATTKTYELQLYASKTDDTKSMKKIIDKASAVNLECSIIKNSIYSFVKCDRGSSWRDIQSSAKKAEKANLQYFILNMKKSQENKIRIKIKEPKIVEKVSNIKKIESEFFSNNSELLNMLYNQDTNSQRYLKSKKSSYLENINKINSTNGLYLKGRSGVNLEERKLDYNLRVEWNILDGGYLGSKKSAKKEELKKELDYDRLLDEINSANLEITLYKIGAITNFIRYQFAKYKESIFFDILQKEKKRYRESLITSNEINKLTKHYESIKQNIDYYALLDHQKYDNQMKSFIQNIENINLVDVNSLIEEAYANSFILKKTKNQISQTKNSKKWSDEIKTNLYIENKKYFFLNSTDTIAGVQVQVPLEFNNEKRDEIEKVEIEATKRRESVTKKLISKTIKETYNKILYYQTDIKTLQKDLKYYQNRESEISIKSKYPLPSQKGDPIKKLADIELSISDISQKIWEERTNILTELLKIQYISGIQILENSIN